MTQQQISKLLDVPDRTLRDWKKSRQRLYTLLESLEYEEVKEKINGVDIDDVDWANEIRKKAYGENWKPSNSSVKLSDFDEFMQENEANLMKFFSTKRPAAYEEFLKEQSE